MLITIFFLFGLIVGSFLNVVIYRMRVAESFVSGGSKCPHCQTPIHWYDNIPLLSFVILNAKCRECKKKISWQYPIVELMTGLLFALVGAKFFMLENFSTWTATAYLLGVVAFFVVMFVYDWLYMELPNAVLWLAVFWSVVFNLILDWGKLQIIGDVLSVGTYSGVLASVVAFTFFFALVWFSKEKWMGMGDAYLVIFLGMVVGWPKIILALMLAFTIGALVGVVLVLKDRKKMKSPIPFAPFLIVGTLIAMFWGEGIISWYLGFLF